MRSDSCPPANAEASGRSGRVEGSELPQVPCLQVEGTRSPRLPAAVPCAAEDLHAHCSDIHHGSLRLAPWELGGSVDTQAPCQQPHRPTAVSPVPRVTLLSPFHPGAVAGKGGGCRCSWRFAARLPGAQPAGCVPAVPGVSAGCAGGSPALCPRLALGCATRCHAETEAAPCPITLPGKLDHGRPRSLLGRWVVGPSAGPRPLRSLSGVGLRHSSLLPLSPTPCSPLSLPQCPSSLLGHRVGADLRGLGQAAPGAALGFPRAVPEQDAALVPAGPARRATGAAWC